MSRFLGSFKRFSIIFWFICWFVATSFLLRLIFLFWQYDEVSWHFTDLLRTLLTGLVFDIGSVIFVSLPAIAYFALLPNRWVGSKFDRIFTIFFFSLTIFLLVFSFFAEITFWDEFRTRFNFIAVDYLIYTHEVVANIQESYPLPLLVGGVALVTILIFFVFHKKGVFRKSFSSRASIGERAFIAGAAALFACFYALCLNNNDAEWSENRYNSEISKSGVYSFFAAFRNNRMDYAEFYTTIPDKEAFARVREKLSGKNVKFDTDGFNIHRTITDSVASEKNPNVVFILVESLSGSFLKEFGNQENITPFMDSLAQQSVFFTNLYATGTRTVRGMEAVTLCIPPTPGQSIVKRPENNDLFTVSNVFRSRNYDCNFFYGGDGYFDNMNAYFGGNGFNIYDRGRGSVLSDKIKTTRHNIEDNEVTFENAWGICDEDIFRKMMTVADEKEATGKPFFNFVMTTSNHRPYTYPEGKIDIRSGKNRQGAVKYTDFALREMFKKASTKPWFKNTVFVIIADHCASSAGKDEIDVKNYHIPAFIVNMPGTASMKIRKQCSQIDLFPTLFNLLHWSYKSDFFGKNVLDSDFEPRAFMGTYRKLTMMRADKVMILSDQKKQAFYHWNADNNNLKALPMDKEFLNETISWYQSADYLFINKLLK
ncbi:MAG: alkaline phosphatase family protein [Flavobacterium sp.]|nr:MAG: alkaline phosphatase family protein [Flavobacterium sp.]